MDDGDSQVNVFCFPASPFCCRRHEDYWRCQLGRALQLRRMGLNNSRSQKYVKKYHVNGMAIMELVRSRETVASVESSNFVHDVAFS